MNQPIEIFIKQVTYLPFDDVISLCQTNTTYHNYCINPKYNTNWKLLIDDTFSKIYDYENKLDEIWSDLKVNKNTYNYLVYTQLIKYLDPITQLMILYRQNDPNFDSNKYKDSQRFLALFLLGDKTLVKYLPDNSYQIFIDLLDGKSLSEADLKLGLVRMIIYGSIKGYKYFENMGVKIDFPLSIAANIGYLNLVKYIIENNIDTNIDSALQQASNKGNLEIVELLLKEGANPDNGLVLAIDNNHLDIVKLLLKEGAKVDQKHIEMTIRQNNLDMFDYLMDKILSPYNIHFALEDASMHGRLNFVKHIFENYNVNKNTIKQAINAARHNGHQDVIDYLKSIKLYDLIKNKHDK